MNDLLEKLAALADELDELELEEEADEIDELLEAIAPLAIEEEKPELYTTICPECEVDGMVVNSPWCTTCKGRGFVRNANTVLSPLELIKHAYVRKRGKKWCVFSKKNKQIACHPTRAAALKQLRAIEASKARRGK